MMDGDIDIFVELLDEGTPCWRPVRATPLRDGVFRISADQAVPDEERWAFVPGNIVLCEEHTFQSGARGPLATKIIATAG
jgi:hypothetical protein